MLTFYFKTSSGQVFSATAPDMDRARCAAKASAGSNWDPKAKLFKVGNPILT